VYHILRSPKALLLHFKRFIVTQEQKAGPLVQHDDGTSAPPIMEMVLRKNKVNLCVYRMLLIICFASYSASSFLHLCHQAKIRLEETLSISPYGGNSNQILPRKYHLRGVVHHIGNTAFSGHYTSCAKRILKDTQGDSSDTFNAQDNEEQWVLFDDRVGTRRPADYVLENERNQRNCYMALYELN
jgi:ubiquitin C-terminal hydrolase